MQATEKAERLILSKFPHKATPSQQDAITELCRFLYSNEPLSLFILNGHAGTGKTTLVSTIIQIAPLLKIRTQLLAPTGRAAKVLSNYSGQAAYTIHKSIYQTITDTGGNRHTVRTVNKHHYTLFIVDEASMIGLSQGGFGNTQRNLLEDLIDYVIDGDHCRLLLLGDGSQLPPVGSDESPALSPEYLMTMNNFTIFSSELKDVVRQKVESGILHNATIVREKIAHMDDFDTIEMPIFDLQTFRDIKRINGGELVEILYEEYEKVGEDGVAIICRSNKRATLFNQAIRSRILMREGEISTGDHIMVVKNNYFWLDQHSPMSFIANGDIAEVLSLRNQQEMYGFHFVDATLKFVDYADEPCIDCKLLLETLASPSAALTQEENDRLFHSVMEDYADLSSKAEQMRALKKNPYYNALQIKFSYALTCHKTQGGQWPVVIVEQGYITDEMLNREYMRWTYTALTRATERVYLLGYEDRFYTETA